MKITKRDDVKYPIKVTLSNDRSIIVPRQSKFKTTWLRKHGCPFVSQYEVYQYLGLPSIGEKKPMDLWNYAKKHLKKYMGATLHIKGVLAEVKHFTKGKATAKYFAPKDITANRIEKYLKAGSIIIITRRKPVIHYYVIVADKGKIYILNAGKCKQITAKQVVSVKCNNKNYGGMIVVTPKKKTTTTKKTTTKKTTTTKKAKAVTAKLVDDVIAGKYGNGEARKKKLTDLGYDYKKVQDAVNKKVKK